MPHRIRVIVDGVTIADSTRAMRVLETSHPPNYYLPPEDVRMDLLSAGRGRSVCEWKGSAAYHHLRVGSACSRTLPGPTRDRSLASRRSPRISRSTRVA
ncbi:MAG: DUF427 domain-containing protein [Candidatus Limnocylindrales bacterium]